jgi:membrane protease YdiL (CAAX protease family)
MLQETVNTAFQLAVVLAICAVAWLAARFVWRDRQGLRAFVGLVAAPPRAMLFALGATFLFGAASLALFKFTSLNALATAPNTVAGQVREMGLSAETAAVIAIVAFLKTALSEEIFFRGLIAKRLIAWLGFGVGNTLHAVLFGAIHLLIFVVPGGPAWDPFAAAAFFAVTGAGGWVMAWLNERVGGGSIAPSWLMHGLANAAAYPVLAFL